MGLGSFQIFVLYLDRLVLQQAVTADIIRTAILLAAEGCGHVVSSLCLLPSGDTVKHRLSPVIRVGSLAKQTYLIFSLLYCVGGPWCSPDVQSSWGGATLNQSACSSVPRSSTLSLLLSGCQRRVQSKAEQGERTWDVPGGLLFVELLCFSTLTPKRTDTRHN